MKKLIFSLLFTLFSGLSRQDSAQAATKSNKILVAYYSYSGNTRTVAQQIQSKTTGDIFELQTVQTYPTDYNTLVQQAKQEINDGYQPELKNQPHNLDNYDVIFLGSPCWWGTVAPAVVTFLANHDLAGKTIVPFMTHEGSGFGHTLQDLKKYAPKATLLEGLAIRGSSVNSSAQQVNQWIDKLNL